MNTPSIRNYNNVSTRNNGFIYRLVPLNTTLSQKGNDTLPYTNKDDFIIGDYVSGVCYYDKKIHTGMITNIIYSEKTDYPIIAYILDDEFRKLLPLKYSTLNIKY